MAFKTTKLANAWPTTTMFFDAMLAGKFRADGKTKVTFGHDLAKWKVFCYTHVDTIINLYNDYIFFIIKLASLHIDILYFRVVVVEKQCYNRHHIVYSFEEWNACMCGGLYPLVQNSPNYRNISMSTIMITNRYFLLLCMPYYISHVTLSEVMKYICYLKRNGFIRPRYIWVMSMWFVWISFCFVDGNNDFHIVRNTTLLFAFDFCKHKTSRKCIIIITRSCKMKGKSLWYEVYDYIALLYSCCCVLYSESPIIWEKSR